MKIEGVPDGWELVRIGVPVVGEHVVSADGDAASVHCDTWLSANHVIIRKVEPACSWPHGVFADGWIAEDQSGWMNWYNHAPELMRNLNEWGYNDTNGNMHFRIRPECVVNPVKFRSDLPWTERIQQVGPTVEKGGV